MQGSMVYPSGQARLVGQINHSSRFACCGWRLVPFMGGRSHAAFRYRLKKTAKEKNLRKSVKAPLWHKPKRNGPCFISLNLLFRHEAKPFSSLMRIVGTWLSKLFWRWCADEIKPLLRKSQIRVKKVGRFCRNLPFYLYFCTWRVLWRLRNAQKYI